jgi:hypothetical protein
MRARLIFGVAVAVCAAGLLAGCGGTSGAGSGSAMIGTGAAVAPADSVAFAAVDTDASSGQWQAVDALLQKFPGHDALLTKLQQTFAQKTKLSWADDVKPALGPELDLVVLPSAANGKPELVGLVRPADGAKFDALVQKLGAGTGKTYVTAQAGGWTAVASSQAALDAVTGATTHLADDNTYQDATSKLSGDALASVYANGTEAHQLLSSLGKSLPTATTGAQLQWVSAEVVAASGGVKVDGFLRTQGGAASPQPYASMLVSKIPSGALLVADFDAASLPAKSPLASALGGETAVYVSPGEPIPSITLVTHPADPQAAAGVLDKAFAGLGSSAAAGSGLGAILGNLHLYHDVSGGTLIASTSQQAIADFQGGGSKLADDSAFKDATSAASMPPETNGFVYVDLHDALPLVEGLAGLMGAKLPAGIQADLAPLQSITAYATTSGDEVSFTVFLAIQ